MKPLSSLFGSLSWNVYVLCVCVCVCVQLCVFSCVCYDFVIL